VANSYPYWPDLDEATAVGLALADVLDGLEWAPGKKLKAVYAGWSEPEDVQVEPAVAVMPIEGTYEGSRSTPYEDEDSRKPTVGAGYILMQDAEFTASVELLVWASDPEMRSRVVRCVREALQEQDVMFKPSKYGLFIAVPRYFGGVVKASVAPQGVRYEDDQDEAEKRHRLAYVRVTVQLPVMRLVTAGGLEVRTVLTVQGDALPAS